MQNTIIAVYDSFDHAQGAMDALLADGFARGTVQLVPYADATGVRRASSLAEQTPDESAIGRFFRSLFGMEHPHHDMYREAVRRGSSVLTLTSVPDAQRDQAVEIMRRFHPVDMEQRVEHWVASGWTGSTSHLPVEGASSGTAGQGDQKAQSTSTPTPRPSGPRNEVPPAHGPAAGEIGYPQYGPVRVYGGTTADALQGATPAERNADMADTLTARDDADYREHWRNVYGSGSARYEDYDAAYRYGARAGATDAYRNARWEEAEPHMRGDWEARHPGRSWEEVREAVRYGTEKTRRG